MKRLFRLICVGFLLLSAGASTLQAHPSPLAQARLQIDAKAQTYELLIDCDVTAMVMGHAPGHLTEDLAVQLAKLTRDQLADHVERIREWFISQMEVAIDRAVVQPAEVVFPDIATIRRTDRVTEPGDDVGAVRTRQSTIIVRGSLPAGARGLALRLPREVGPALLVARRDAVDLPMQLLAAYQRSRAVAVSDQPLPADADAGAEGEEEDAGGGEGIPPGVITAGQFLALGFWHIIPDGPDHILFVLGLFLLSAHWKPLLWQVTAFTLAHSVTLALAMYDVVRLPSNIVEPLIAASIAFIAIENLFTTKLQPWRPIVVFAFGLLHGLGFAGVLSELQLPAGQFAPAILGFNLGVEAGQLAVIGLAFLAVGWWRQSKHYRSAVIIPASLVIAIIGIYWTIERVMGA